MRFIPPLFILVAAILSLSARSVSAHGDEDHSQDKKEVAVATDKKANGGTRDLSRPQRLPDGSLFIPKALQRQLEVRTQRVHLGNLDATVELNGRVISDPDAGGRVQATMAGSIMPTARGMPVPGRKVTKGELLAYLRPIGSAIDRGNQQAQQADLEAQLAIAEHRLTRYRQLEGAVPQKEIEAAQIERKALEKRRNFVSASINRAEPLLAPATGIISTSNVVAGQVVDAKEILFEVIDPNRLSVEALAYDTNIAPTLLSATALAEQTALQLKFIGGGRQLREQALPLLFRITSANVTVAVGQPVKVIVRVRNTASIKGATVKRSALTKNSAGEAILWVHTEAERFVARRVRHQPLDAEHIAILDGLHEGDRVVIQAASLLSEVR